MAAFPGGPPAVCPSLILPKQEAKFMISLDSMLRPDTTAGMLDIKGSSGRTLLRAQLGACAEAAGRICLSLASVGCEDDPRTRILSPAPGQPGFELYGRGNRYYGSLEPSAASTSCRVLIFDGEPVLTLDFEDRGALKVVARSLADEELGHSVRAAAPALASSASTSVGSRMTGPSEILRLNVRPNVDAVLITSCILAMVLFDNRGAQSPRLSAISPPRRL